MTNERRQLIWEAKVDLHDGRRCDICGTPARINGLVGPAPNPDWEPKAERR